MSAPTPPPMNLVLTVRTMTRESQIQFSRGDLALSALNKWDADPFTVSVILHNLVRDPATGDPVPVLVWESRDLSGMPRWVSRPAAVAAQVAAAMEGISDG